MFNVPRHAASPRYVSNVRFVALCRRTHFRCSWLHWCVHPAGLWERRAGPSGLPDASTPVGPELGGSTDLPAVISLHWLWVPVRIQYKLADLAYKVTWQCITLPRSADPCRQLAWSTNTPIRSTNANRLLVPPVKLSTVGSRAFAVAAPHIWNTLPTDVVAASSLSTFRRLLKRFLFKQSYPDITY